MNILQLPFYHVTAIENSGHDYHINARRYQCKACERTFFETLPDMDERRMMTKRLIAWIGQQSVKRTFLQVSANNLLSVVS